MKMSTDELKIEIEKKMNKVCEYPDLDIKEETAITEGIDVKEEDCVGGFLIGSLPEDYLWFVRKFGNWQVWSEIVGMREENGENVFEPLELTEGVRDMGYPDGYLVIEDLGEFQCSLSIKEGKVYRWSGYDSSGMTSVADSFLEFLDESLSDTLLELE